VRLEARNVPLRRAGIRRSAELDDSVRTDELAWLTREEAKGALAQAVVQFETLMNDLNESAWVGLRTFDLQLARYAPGGHYARHRDAFPGQDNRRITAIVYLNSNWRPEHGGELQLHVTPPIQIEPTLDRLVVFRSEVVEHEVLEAHEERWALTAWYSAK
jgi:SM-20-related protein